MRNGVSGSEKESPTAYHYGAGLWGHLTGQHRNRYAWGVNTSKHMISNLIALGNKGDVVMSAWFTPVIGEPCTTQMDGKQQAVTNMQNPAP